jgi:hypothetical protein
VEAAIPLEDAALAAEDQVTIFFSMFCTIFFLMFCLLLN